MAELQLSPSLSPELLLPMSVKHTASVSATIAVPFQKVLAQFFSSKSAEFLSFPICYQV